MNVYLVSLGCSKNLVDSEQVLGLLRAQGYRLTLAPEAADVFLINTCGFIAAARAEAHGVIAEALDWRRQDGGVVAVIGCLAQREAAELRRRYPGIDVIAGFSGYQHLPRLLAAARQGRRATTADPHHHEVPQAPRPVRLTGGASAFLKLGEGCGKRCSFCAIPAIRGPQKSVPPELLAARARALTADGVKEIILISQDPVAYGQDLEAKPDLFDALEAIESAPGLEWVRLHYLYPGETARRLLERMAGRGKLLPYLDLPLQHAHPEMLRAMKRPPPAAAREFLLAARQRISGLVLRTTFLVGFPGEEERHFDAVLELITAVEFDRIGAFVFSPERDTPACGLPDQVPAAVAAERRARLMELAGEISHRRNAALVGQTLDVLIDRPSADGQAPAVGRTPGQAPEVDGVTYVEGEGLSAGRIVPVRITGGDAYDLRGQARSGPSP